MNDMGINKPTYNIGDYVYHVLPESHKGIVIDAMYKLSSDTWEYLVTFAPNDISKWYCEVELQTNKSFV